MRVALVHNTGAGSAGSEGELLAALEAVGWRVRTRLEPSQLDALPSDVDVVVVAGGDGTVAKVAKRLAGVELPMAIVPMGTVNNVARSLGIGVDAKTALAGLSRVERRTLDLGAARSGDRRERFIEGFGVGIFAHVIRKKATEEHKPMPKAHGLLADELERYEPRYYHVEVEGRDLSGEYILVAAMNMRSVGPALHLAPEARFDDGVLDLIRVRAEARRAWIEHLRQADPEGDLALPAFDTCRTQHVIVRSDGRSAHLDDESWCLDDALELGVERAAVRLLVPASR